MAERTALLSAEVSSGDRVRAASRMPRRCRDNAEEIMRLERIRLSLDSEISSLRRLMRSMVS